MTELPRCPRCGTELPADAPAGLCPKCLVQAAFAQQSVMPSASKAVDPGVEPTLRSPAASKTGFEPPTQDELIPLFPQLEVLEFLGKGGMGAVYKARQPGLDRLVAIKILPAEIGQSASFAERFTREARSLARLSHSHIVTVHDFGQVKDLFYIVMEFVDGVNLRQAIQTGLTPAAALAIVPQICEALQFAHDEGIVHRDIKPENILIDKRGRVKIVDFGLAKLLGTDGTDHSLTATHQVMGTPRYMAPEQMQGKREVDHRADIYSLGVVFYELLTGTLPMGKFAPPSKRVSVDVRLDEIVLRALEQEPEHRYQHASEIKTDVENFTRQPAVQIPVPSKPVIPPTVSDSTGLWTNLIQTSAWAGVIGFAMCMLQSGWPLLILFCTEWTQPEVKSEDAKRWSKLFWLLCVVGLSLLGMGITNSFWPVAGLLFLVDWNTWSKTDSESEEESARDSKSSNVETELHSSVPVASGTHSKSGMFAFLYDPSMVELNRTWFTLGWCIVGGLDALGFVIFASLADSIKSDLMGLFTVCSMLLSCISFFVAHCIYVRQNFDLVRKLSYLGLLPFSMGSLVRIPLSVTTLIWQQVPSTRESFESTPWPETKLGQHLSGSARIASRSLNRTQRVLIRTFVTFCLLALWSFSLGVAEVIALVYMWPRAPSVYEVYDEAPLSIKGEPQAALRIFAVGSGPAVGITQTAETYRRQEVVLASGKENAEKRLQVRLGEFPLNQANQLPITIADVEKFLTNLDGKSHSEHAANVIQVIRELNKREGVSDTDAKGTQQNQERFKQLPEIISRIESEIERANEKGETKVEVTAIKKLVGQFVAPPSGYLRLCTMLDRDLFEIDTSPERTITTCHFKSESWLLLLAGSFLVWLIVSVLIVMRRHSGRTVTPAAV